MNDEERLAVTLFMGTLGISQPVATALVAAGTLSVEEIAYVPIAELLEVPGVSEPDLRAAREAARRHLLVSPK